MPRRTASAVGPAPLLSRRGQVRVREWHEPPEPLDLAAGVKHRFRIVNFHTFMANLKIEIKDGSGLLSGRALAKDGRDLPENQQTVRPAQQVVSIGETYDFEFIPEKPADYRLEIFDPIFGKVMNTVRIHARQHN